ncbi:MAG: hypothetical protein HKN47_16695 [Pirellulaceae bacterium]|nr:hypothetical protein [Pirellulaceae bacterium]
MLRQVFSRLCLALLLAVAYAPGICAQHGFDQGASLAPQRLSQPNRPIVSRLVDPFLTTQHERELKTFLRSPVQSGERDFAWDASTTLIDIQRALATHVEIQIDHRALDEIGLSASDRVFPALSPQLNRSVPDALIDPFANGPDSALQSTSVSTSAAPVPDAGPRVVRQWWKTDATVQRINSATVASRLFYFLDQLDLTLAIRMGQPLITTVDRADECLCTCVYDVTPLAAVQPAAQRQMGRPIDHLGAASYRDDGLITLIEYTIDPETWESMGGPSTNQMFSCNDRHLMVFSAKLTTHWKIQALLDRLNNAP